MNGCLAVTSGSVAKGLAIDLEVIDSGQVPGIFPLCLSFLLCIVCITVFHLRNHGTLTISTALCSYQACSFVLYVQYKGQYSPVCMEAHIVYIGHVQHVQLPFWHLSDTDAWIPRIIVSL